MEPPPPDNVVPAPMRPCARCGQHVRAGERACPHCGATLPAASARSWAPSPAYEREVAPAYGPPPFPLRPGRAWVFWLLFVAGLIGAGWWLGWWRG